MDRVSWLSLALVALVLYIVGALFETVAFLVTVAIVVAILAAVLFVLDLARGRRGSRL